MLGNLPVTNGEPNHLGKGTKAIADQYGQSILDLIDRRYCLGELTIARSGLPSALTSPDIDVERRITAREKVNPRVAGNLPLPVTEKNRDVVAFEVRADDIRPAIAVQIGDADPLVGVRCQRLRMCPASQEAALAVAEQNRQAVFSPTVSHQIKAAVAVEVAGSHAVDVRPDNHGKRRVW